VCGVKLAGRALIAPDSVSSTYNSQHHTGSQHHDLLWTSEITDKLRVTDRKKTSLGFLVVWIPYQQLWVVVACSFNNIEMNDDNSITITRIWRKRSWWPGNFYSK